MSEVKVAAYVATFAGEGDNRYLGIIRGTTLEELFNGILNDFKKLNTFDESTLVDVFAFIENEDDYLATEAQSNDLECMVLSHFGVIQENENE